MRTHGGWRSRHPMLATAVAAAVAAWLIGIGVYGLLRDDFAVPVTRGYLNRYYHFHGAAAGLICGGFVCVGASIVVVIWRRLRGSPDRKVDWGAAEIMAVAGTFIVLTMMALKSLGLV